MLYTYVLCQLQKLFQNFSTLWKNLWKVLKTFSYQQFFGNLLRESLLEKSNFLPLFFLTIMLFFVLCSHNFPVIFHCIFEQKVDIVPNAFLFIPHFFRRQVVFFVNIPQKPGSALSMWEIQYEYIYASQEDAPYWV